MERTLKRVLSIFIMCSMIISLMPLTFAESPEIESILVSEGIFEPEFDITKDINYLFVNYKTESIKLTVKAEGLITINGAPVESGVESEPIALSYGYNNILIKVKNNDLQKVNTINIFRPTAPDLIITEAIINGNNVLSQDAFDCVEIYNASGHTINLKDYKLGFKYDSGDMDDPVFTGETVFTGINEITKTSTHWGNSDEEPDEILMKAGETWTVWIKYIPEGNFDKDTLRALTYKDLADNAMFADPDKTVLAEWPKDKEPVVDLSDKFDKDKTNFHLVNVGLYGAEDQKRIFIYVLKDTAEIDDTDITKVVKNENDIVSYAKLFRMDASDNGSSTLLEYQGNGHTQMKYYMYTNNLSKIFYWQKPEYTYDTKAPEISFNPPSVLAPGSAYITATLTDDYDIRYGRVYYKTKSMNDWMYVEHDFVYDDSKDKTKANMKVKLPQLKLEGESEVSFYIEASDGKNITLKGSIDNPYTVSLRDMISPVISEVYPKNGDVIKGIFTGSIYAELSDDLGIDKTTAFAAIKKDGETVASASLPQRGVSDIALWHTFPDMALLPGDYTLTIEVSDLAGNKTIKNSKFTVSEAAEEGIYHNSPKILYVGEDTTLFAFSTDSDDLTLNYALSGSEKFETVKMEKVQSTDGGNLYKITLPADKFADLGRIDYYFTSGKLKSETYTVAADGKSFEEILSSDKPLRWLFLGDSITQNYAHTNALNNYMETLEQRIKFEMGRSEDVFINSGVSGQKTSDILKAIEHQALQFNPDVVFINIGMNDRKSMKPEEIAAVKSDLTTIINKLRNVNGKVPKICFLTVVPRGVTYSMDYMVNLETVNHIYYMHLDVIKEQGLQYVDLFKTFMLNREIDSFNQIYKLHSDHTHPNCVGHLLMATTVMKGIGIYDQNSEICNMTAHELINLEIRPKEDIKFTVEGGVEGTFEALKGGSIDWAIIGANQMATMNEYTGGRSIGRHLENSIRRRTSTASVFENRVFHFTFKDKSINYFNENFEMLIGPNTPDSKHPIKYYFIMPEVPELYKVGYQHSSEKVAEYKKNVEELLAKTKADLNILITPPASSNSKINECLADYAKALREIKTGKDIAIIDVYKIMNENMNASSSLKRNWFLEDGTINFIAARDIALMIIKSVNENGGNMLESDVGITPYRDKGEGVRFDNLKPSYSKDNLNVTIDVSKIVNDNLYSGKDLTFMVYRENGTPKFNGTDRRLISYAKPKDSKITIHEAKAGSYIYRVAVKTEDLVTEFSPLKISLSGGTEVVDVATSAWYYDYVMSLLKDEIIGGENTEGGILIRPNDVITREETAKVITGVFNLRMIEGSISEGDNSSEWAKDYLTTVKENGIMLGSDGMMNGRSTATRAEVATMIGRAMGLGSADRTVLDKFEDEELIPEWAKDGVSVLVKAGVLGGYEDGCLHLENNITRAELFAMVSRILTAK